MKPTFLAWLVMGLFLAVLIAVVALSYSPTPFYIRWAGKFVVALIALVAIYLHSDQARK
jgi:membrane protein YdbS with pleckstrin-like domain